MATPPPRPDIDAIYRDALGPEKVSSSAAMRYLGWTLVFLAFAPPIVVMLWRIATMPWGAQ